MNHKPLFKLFILYLLAICSGALQAQTATGNKIYQVDLIVFRHLDANGMSSETWQRPDPIAELSLDELEAIDEPDELTEYLNEPNPVDIANIPEMFRLLDPADAGLQNESALISNSSYYELLLHTSWQQEAPGKQQAEAFPVIAAGADPQELDGTVLLYKERYLHVGLDLAIPASRNSMMSSGRIESFTLKQSRRVNRANVLHYFDHPKLGVLVKVTEVEDKEEE